jgi:extracellular elastinolytic metalloproteinase
MSGSTDSGRRAPIRLLAAAILGVAVVLSLPVPAFGGGEVLPDVDTREGSVAPTAAQQAAVEALGASVVWNEFGTPHSLVKHGGYLAENVGGASAVQAARNWLDAQKALFRLGSAGGLAVHGDSALLGSEGHVVHLRQEFGGLAAAEGGLVTVGLVGSPASGWKVAYASSTLTGDTALAAQPALSATGAWSKAAASVGRGVTLFDVGKAKAYAGWSAFGVRGFAEPQRARLVAVPTPADGVRPAWETLVVDNQAGHATAYQVFVDAAGGDVLLRKNLVEQSHQAAETFSGSVPPTDGACDTDKGPWTVADGESVGSVAVAVEATLTANDSVIHLLRDGVVVASQDTGTSPEALLYDPSDQGRGTYHVRVCDFGDGAPWLPPTTYDGQIVFNPVEAALPYPPKWKVFPGYPLIGGETSPWGYPSTDTRELWCWESTIGSPPAPLPECDREVQNSASRAPWDYSARTGTPTFTTVGNNARSAEAWTTPLTPGPTGFRPVSLQREYVYPWTNEWFTSKCNSAFVPGQSHDVSAAVTNLFAMHNRMHDWTYNLGFTERHWNAQESNFGTGGTAENDPLTGDAQAGAATGGFPSYLGRDNANMVPLPDGVAPITNMYLWQPIAGTFYAPCVDGDYDMAVIGHEFGHLVENRMIGKGGTRGGHHAGAMGESSGDLMGTEYLNEYGFVPVSGENPFAVGAYVTGNKQRAIRNYGMNFPRTGAFPEPGVTPRVDPLNFSDLGYDLTGAQVHADGEIWSATNFDIRQALAAKYNASFPSGNAALQASCADGERPADLCPGNRRWIQIMFDAYLLMPTAPSMLEARDAYLAADVMRFGGANQSELWLAFARRGFGEEAAATNTAAESDTDPVPDFAAPTSGEATVRFQAVAAHEGGAPVNARVYVGHYEARVSPIADTNPATSGAPNLDDVARFVPGTYELVANAPGYGHTRFRLTLSAGSNRTVTISLPTNVASREKGAVATGDGVEHDALIDDTEATNWDRTGAAPDVRGTTVTVDLAGGTQTFDRVQVSAMLHALPGLTGPTAQNRFTALRQFEIWACNAATTNCIAPAIGFTRVYTSPANAFPGFNPRPVSPELILRSFAVPRTTATHVQIRVLTNQCTGNTAFQGEQDNDPLNGTDCREGSPGAGTVAVFGDLPQVVAPRDDEVHVAELQVFRGSAGVKVK